MFDVNAAAMADVARACEGRVVRACASPAEVARACRKLITMPPNGKIVDGVFNDPQTGIFRAVQRGAVVVDPLTVEAAASPLY